MTEPPNYMCCPIPNLNDVFRSQKRLYVKSSMNLKACGLSASALGVQTQSRAEHPVLKEKSSFNLDLC